MLQRYFQENKIAITFDSKEEHKEILKFFNCFYLPRTSGICSFYKKSYPNGFRINYQYSSAEVVKGYDDYVVLTYKEFTSLVTGDVIELFENN